MTQPRVTSFAPQFLVDDLERSMTYYRKLGFTFGEPWDGFYAIGEMDGLELHLKEAPKCGAERQHRREHEHLDAAAGVDGIEAFYAQCVANGATILRHSRRPRGGPTISTSRTRMAMSSRSGAVRLKAGRRRRRPAPERSLTWPRIVPAASTIPTVGPCN
jgi:catechol 2,3-dioxygenase-like lactoylglutathione lyase family enzyme